MSSPQRATSGINNILPGQTMSQFPSMDSSLVYGYFNDFFQYTATDWVINTTEAGNGSATEAISNVDAGGVLGLLNDDANEDHDNLQLSKDGGTNDSETFLFATGKKAWFKTKIKSNDGDKVHIFIGLHIANTDPVNAAPTDGVYFEITGGVINCQVRKNSVSSTETLAATLGDNTFITLGYYWDGVDIFHVFVDDVEVVTIGSTNLPDDEYLAVSMGVENEEASANSLNIDYIGAWMER